MPHNAYNKIIQSLLPIDTTMHNMTKRNQRQSHTKTENTNRLNKLALPYMTKLMNDENVRRNVQWLWQSELDIV